MYKLATNMIKVTYNNFFPLRLVKYKIIEQIKADNPYGFKYIEKFDIYYLTDYEENNVKIDDDYITYSYWPENLTKQDE